MAIDAVKVEPQHQNFLDNHFGINPQWSDFHKKLKNHSFVNAVSADTRSDDRLKEFAKIIGMREQAKGPSLKVPSDVSGSYRVKYHSSVDRFSCTCPDWTYKKSVGGGDCKHIDRIKSDKKESLMKVASVVSPTEVLFRVGRVVNREHKDRADTEKLKAENLAYDTAYPRTGFISQWVKHAFAQELTKKMAQSAKRLLAP